MDIITIRDYQNEIIETTIKYFDNNDKAILNMCCGSGKTITSLFLSKKLNVKKLLILVPSVILLNQWFDIILHIFPNKKIKAFRKNIKNFDILISTYHNSLSIKQLNFEFDLIILDECHHLTGSSDNLNSYDRIYLHALNILSKKQLGLTATLKKIKTKNIIDNYSTEYFGDIIVNKNIKWGIDNNIITDFNIQLLIINDDILLYDINKINNNRLYLSAYIALYNLSNKISTNILIYANKIKHIDEIMLYINLLLNNNIFLFNQKVDIYKCTSDTNYDISNLDNNNYNILCSVYSLGEGFDLPFLDSVIFSENMTSDIRIVQSMLRPCRNFNTKKIALIVVPIICNQYIAYNDEFKKIRQIIKSINNDQEYINNYYLSKITFHELNIISNKNIIINYDLIKINKYLDNIIMSKNEFKLNDNNNSFLFNNFTFSKILNFTYNDEDINKLSAQGIIHYLYNEVINDSNIILKNTTLTGGVLNKGIHPDKKVRYLEKLDLFLRGIDSNTAIKEIVTISIRLNLKIFIRIQLKNKEIIEFENIDK